jgi:hypothetical protein
MSSGITGIITDDNSARQSPFPCWSLSIRRSTLSRALSPEYANESAGFARGPVPVPHRVGYGFYVIYIWNYADPVACQDIMEVSVLVPLSHSSRLFAS